MRVTKREWIQLAVLCVIAVITCGVMLLNYVKLPAILGVGRYAVTLKLPTTGGLYPTSNVTYRGVQIGQVKNVELNAGRVEAVLSLDSAVKVPADARAEVHSRSAVGEQYVDFTDGSDDAPPLRDGDIVTVDRSEIPVNVAQLLDATNRALQAVPADNLRTVVDEAFVAVGGLGPELSRIVDGSTSLAIDAGRTIDPMTRLIEDAEPVLNSQIDTGDSIATWANRLAAITTQLDAQDAAVADLMEQSGPALAEGQQLLNRIAPALPIVLANLVSLGEIAVAYNANIEQILVLLPQNVAVAGAPAVANSKTKQDYNGYALSFNLNFGLPQPCLTGFLPPSQRRSADEVDYPAPPVGDLYCRIPQDSVNGVRGMRNIPCATVPGTRAATAAMCESGEQYVPLNDGNAWKGDPNATDTGQSVPDLRPMPPTAEPAPSSGPPPLTVAAYDPATGSYTGPDGHQYTQASLAPTPAPPTWQSMMLPPITAADP